MEQDEAVKATNNDASTCKRAAVERGYWRDPYIQYFIRNMERKDPEINRGYFARVQGMKNLLKQFLEVTGCQCQIINLGAGFDTTYWNLKDEGLAPIRFIEVDFQGVTAKKCYYVKNRKPLLEKLQKDGEEVKFSKTDLHSTSYHIVGADLRKVQELEQTLQQCDCDKNLPTLFMAECVLVYMSSQSSQDLVSWITQQFQTAFFINYEQVNMGDRFGQVMVENLKTRGCTLAGLQHCQSLDTQKQRFMSCGWENAEALDMNVIYRSLPQAEVQSISGLESLQSLCRDLYSHYAICWAYKDPLLYGLKTIDPLKAVA